MLDILTNSNEELGMGLSNSNTGGNSRINFKECLEIVPVNTVNRGINTIEL